MQIQIKLFGTLLATMFLFRIVNILVILATGSDLPIATHLHASFGINLIFLGTLLTLSITVLPNHWQKDNILAAYRSSTHIGALFIISGTLHQVVNESTTPKQEIVELSLSFTLQSMAGDSVILAFTVFQLLIGYICIILIAVAVRSFLNSRGDSGQFVEIEHIESLPNFQE